MVWYGMVSIPYHTIWYARTTKETSLVTVLIVNSSLSLLAAALLNYRCALQVNISWRIITNPKQNKRNPNQKSRTVQENPSYLALWGILAVKELFNAVILGFLVRVQMFHSVLGSLIGVYFVLVIISLVGLIINLLGLLVNRDEGAQIGDGDLTPAEAQNLVNIYQKVFVESII